MKVFQFPSFPIAKQLFHVPGAAIEGGFTSGGARIVSPEPGGFSILEIEPALITTERQYPLASWLMSKTNGQVLRVRLAPTPQIASLAQAVPVPWRQEDIHPQGPWSNMQNWAGDLIASFTIDSLVGTDELRADLAAIGPILQPGHVIGHAFDAYLIDEIDYATNGQATFTVTPSLRRSVATGDQLLFRPWFTGSIANPSDFRNSYDAENAGLIQLNKILLSEVVL